MDKLEFFIAAMNAGEYRRRAWVISAFSLIQEGPDDWKKDPYPYRIVQTPVGAFFVNPENTSELVRINGTVGTDTPFFHKDAIELKAGQIPNVKVDLTTTYGNLFFNYATLIYAFNDKLDFLTGRLKPSQIEALILPELADDPVEASSREEVPVSFVPPKPITDKTIFVSEYLKFANAMFYLAAFTQLWVPAATEKSMQAPPGIKELRERLLAENAGRLHDPAVIAKIDAELVKFDAEYLKGDRSEGFLISSKSRNIVRKKLFLMHGAETGITERMDVELIPTSLSEGWDISKFPVMNNSLRAGSFNRGAQTMLGGESVKWLLRASSNIAVTSADCGSRLGNVTIITEFNRKRYYGLSVVTNEGHKRLNEETVQKYYNKPVMIRSPMYCKSMKTDYCAACCGDDLSLNPTALSSAVSDYGSAFLAMYLAAAHAKALIVSHMDFMETLQ